MTDRGRLFWLAVGLLLGGGAVALWLGHQSTARAANDRYEDYILCTGTVSSTLLGGRSKLNSPLDGVWLLDYRSGKLLGTVVERAQGKIFGYVGGVAANLLARILSRPAVGLPPPSSP